jgi:ABC-type Fe3+/spermidine/putrescine transport system ATPase subunit
VKADAATAITLDRVTKIYDAPVVSDVSLDITGGSFVTLLGPSGSGKSTILQMIGGFLPPTSGRILFGG